MVPKGVCDEIDRLTRTYIWGSWYNHWVKLDTMSSLRIEVVWAFKLQETWMFPYWGNTSGLCFMSVINCGLSFLVKKVPSSMIISSLVLLICGSLFLRLQLFLSLAFGLGWEKEKGLCSLTGGALMGLFATRLTMMRWRLFIESNFLNEDIVDTIIWDGSFDENYSPKSAYRWITRARLACPNFQDARLWVWTLALSENIK